MSEICRILLIEDNPGDVLLVEESLREKNIAYELTHYDAADVAIRAIGRYKIGSPDVPNVLLLDYSLPAGDARDVLIAAAKNPALANTRKAVVTSSVSPHDRELAFRYGAERFILKPGDLDEFLTEVGDALRTLCEDATAVPAA